MRNWSGSVGQHSPNMTWFNNNNKSNVLSPNRKKKIATLASTIPQARTLVSRKYMFSHNIIITKPKSLPKVTKTQSKSLQFHWTTLSFLLLSMPADCFHLKTQNQPLNLEPLGRNGTKFNFLPWIYQATMHRSNSYRSTYVRKHTP